MSPFAAVERLDDEAWRDLAALAATRGQFVLFRDTIPAPPPAWGELTRGAGHQLVLAASGLRRVPPVATVELTEEDAPDMLALVAATEPGPFLPRTPTMGRYFGHRHDGQLVAMAGERLRPEGWTEISAVCTDPSFRGRGLAAALTQHVADGILARGEVPFLHVATDNVTAQRVYERLGFERRRTVHYVLLAPPAEPEQPSASSSPARANRPSGELAPGPSIP